MLTVAESNACRACATSKRKCGRQLPSCARCRDRGTSCVYPLSRGRAATSSRPLLPDALKRSMPLLENELLAENVGNTSFHTADLVLADNLMLDLAFPLINTDFAAASSVSQTPGTPTARADWFLAPDTWRISHDMDCAGGIAAMKHYVAQLQSWIERWVTTGSNPFIHPRLYSTNFPACLQVAYATMASYVHRTPANTDIVLQIVEDRSNDLLRDNGASLDSVGADEWIEGREQDVDLFAQLTRLHALLVYQIIGLFDGDIRARHVAEGHKSIQIIWAGKLLQSAAKALSNTRGVATHLTGYLPGQSTYSQQQWHLWILSESIRRTWLVAVSLPSVFCALQQRWSVCPGAIKYTNRTGFWNAASATEWEKRCLERDATFLDRFECSKLFHEADPADVDEFGTAMLDMTFDADLMERWRDRGSGL